MGRPLPGYQISLVDMNDQACEEGEVAVQLQPRPTGLMIGYMDDPERTAAAMQNGLYHTGDQACVDDDGYFFFVGRGDDVFKCSDYRISPFELESALMEHPLVAEVAIVPSPIRCVPMFLRLYHGLTRGPPKRSRARFCSLPRRSWRPTSACGSSNSTSCQRQSRERSAGPNCARWKRNA